MRPDRLRALADDKLREEEESTYQELLNLRLRIATNQITNTSELRTVRRKLAQIKTLRRERALAGAQA